MGDAPRLKVALEALRPGRGPAAWRAAWRLSNGGTGPVTVRKAWHPHGRFRSRRRAISLRIPAGASRTLELATRSDVAAGEVVENAFLILQAVSARRRWRILARFTLRGQTGAPPAVSLEAVDANAAAD
ncbi:MAG: hypothetical protein A3G84_04005 [Chloroflexi bacterium RIFCSPLOWO2_12_FULL_71_12]|nr:MAG: hypothetical protein A3H36_01580 [Chloroflexi bacterium RIFCSPLOWO2_02_FULL_71_16]OGO73485.1 MAG: hypothetical protein A3G84_04005 [Chloroflexi bacterium RIFCSPLOWO2_12_FULL_71_12]